MRATGLIAFGFGAFLFVRSFASITAADGVVARSSSLSEAPPARALVFSVAARGAMLKEMPVDENQIPEVRSAGSLVYCLCSVSDRRRQYF
jgi:hypothetical protein